MGCAVPVHPVVFGCLLFLTNGTNKSIIFPEKTRVPSVPVGLGGRIDNPVQFRNGTATVGAEAGGRTKVSHWGHPREGVPRRGCTSQETCSGLPSFPRKVGKSGIFACGNTAAAVHAWTAAFLLEELWLHPVLCWPDRAAAAARPPSPAPFCRRWYRGGCG